LRYFAAPTLYKYNKLHLRDDEGDETNFNEVRKAILTARDGSLDQRDDGHKDEDTDEDVVHLLPDALQKSHLLLLGELVRSILLETSLGLFRRQTIVTNVFSQAENAASVLLGHIVNVTCKCNNVLIRIQYWNIPLC
jgi:hypothetical protein